MKTICTFLLLFATICGKTQSFEGIVRWSMTMEITDPAMKAQMEQAQQQLNDPETQASIKEMQEKMNTPEMKKMMEANPQMKASIEAAMKSANSGGAPAGMNMMPTGMVTKIKGATTVTIMEGGMANGMEIIHTKDKPSTRVNRAEKTFSRMPEGQKATSNQVKVTKTTETVSILGYNCSKYLAEVTEMGKTATQVFWTTTDIKDMDMKALSRQRGQGGQAMFYDQIEGIPLRCEFSSPQGKMIMEAMEIKRQKMNDADFVVPADFTEVKSPGY